MREPVYRFMHTFEDTEISVICKKTVVGNEIWIDTIINKSGYEAIISRQIILKNMSYTINCFDGTETAMLKNKFSGAVENGK